MLLVTGASGFVGRHLLSHLGSLSPAVIPGQGLLPVYRSAEVPGGVSVDLTNAAEVSKLLDRRPVSAVIHLAAEARPGLCEADPAAAHSGNVLATENLLAACGARAQLPYFLHISTDMVFKGDRDGCYHEHDLPDPLNEYGKSKADAEALVKGYRGPWCIVRPALVYGSPISGKASFLSWMLEALQSGTGRFFTDERRTPVWVNDLVSLLVILLANRHQGIVHAGGLESLSRVEFAEIAAEIWGIPTSNILVTSLDDDAANRWRPRNVCLASPTAHRLHQFNNTKSALEQIRLNDTLISTNRY